MLCTGYILSRYEGTPLDDATMYRSTIDALQYYTLTHCEIAYVFDKLCQFLSASIDIHGITTKRLLHYLKGTLSYGLFLAKSFHLNLTAFNDADWASYTDDRKSTWAYCVYLGDCLVSRKSGKQKVVSHYYINQNIEVYLPLL